ncbi:conserved hypothetical protein [Beggiatoa sp. PS]|nr:conserved hypothetical protein [Beggiatoa sp. PS]
MNALTFESQLLPEGYLYCPKKFHHKNARFQVTVIFEDTTEAGDHDIELAAIQDASNDFLSQKEINYYLKLEEL